MYKIMFSAGEASGDLHGERLAQALKRLAPDIRLTGFGGPKMAGAGVELCQDFRAYSVMGVWEVIKNLHRIFALRDKLLHFMQEERPDLLVLIDYPDFNWRLAKKARAMGIPVFSYIPPSAWAWRKGRARSCAAIADELVTIFPFDLEVYRQAGANVSFVGNPLVDIVKPSLTAEEAGACFGIAQDTLPVLLLPGSRKQEIEQLLPVMLASARQLRQEMPAAEFFLPVAPGINRSVLETMADDAGVKVHFTTDHTYDLKDSASLHWQHQALWSWRQPSWVCPVSFCTECPDSRILLAGYWSISSISACRTFWQMHRCSRSFCRMR